jgi:hypothetical protein
MFDFLLTYVIVLDVDDLTTLMIRKMDISLRLFVIYIVDRLVFY